MLKYTSATFDVDTPELIKCETRFIRQFAEDIRPHQRRHSDGLLRLAGLDDTGACLPTKLKNQLSTAVRRVFDLRLKAHARFFGGDAEVGYSKYLLDTIIPEVKARFSDELLLNRNGNNRFEPITHFVLWYAIDEGLQTHANLRPRPKDSFQPELGYNISRLRRLKGWTGKKFSELVHCSHDTMKDIETGKTDPHPETLAEIIRVLEVTQKQLLS